jgi:carboxypeptidase family protein
MNWKRFFAVVFALLVALSLSSTRLAAQTATTGDIAGVVTDPSNSVVPEAKVDLKDNAKGNTQGTKTSKDGDFHFFLLSPGSYTLTVTASGFQIGVRQVQVSVGQIFTADMQLSLGASTQTVTVTEAAPLIQTENGDTGTSLSEQQVQNVPNPGNDLSAIAQLAPGVVTNTQSGFGNVEAFGLPATSNLFTINGMDDNDPFLNVNNSGATNLLLGSNEIQEADVVTNGYSSSYGTFAGIDVNYITKSGGNDFHGNAIYYWNGRAMNANDWLDKAEGNPRPFDNANQWAASIGGPIKKDKLFFFFNTEGLRVLIPVPSLITVPTAAFEQATIANLTALGDTASIPFYCQNLAGICPGVTAQNSKDGAGMFNLFNGVANQSTAQNNLPNGGCDDVTLAGFGGPVAGAIKNPSGARRNGTTALTPCTETIFETPINFAPEKQIAGRGDWNIGPNDRAYVRMQYDQGIQPTDTDPVNPLFNTQSNQPEYQGQLNETHIFSPTLTNQFLMASTWYSAIFKSPDESAAFAAFPGTLLLNDGALSNIGGALFDFPQGRNVTQIQFGDDISKTIGNHTIKFGGKLHKNYVSDHDNGIATTPLLIPLSLSDFFNGGDPAAAGGGLIIQHFAESQDLPIRLYEVAGYVLDEWRVKPNFTITPALRLEHASNPVCATNCFAQFAAPLSTISGEPTAPYNTEIQDGRSQALLSYQNLQWEPRVSFAWQPFGSSTEKWKSNLVVRGGVGLFDDIFPGTIADNMSGNPPVLNAFTIASTSINGTCPGFLSPNQTPGSNLTDCASGANTAFNTAFAGGGNTTAFPPSVTFTQAQTKAPEFYKWSLEVQKGFGPNDSISVEYVGNHGIHIPVIDNSINAFASPDTPFVNPGTGAPVAFVGLPGVPASAQYGPLTEILSAGTSNYNGGTVSYKHRFSGFAGSGVVQLNYTYSHAFDDVSNGGFLPFSDNSGGGAATSVLSPENPFNIKGNYGPADYDVRHNANANFVWEIPVRKALLGHGWAPLVDGWQTSGAVFYRTGLPFSALDPSFTGQNNYEAALFPAPIAPITNNSCNSEKNDGPNAVPCAFAADFGAPATETGFGGRGLRNALRGPSYTDTNFSFTKKTKIPGWERGEFQLGLQFFNLFNHPNFNLPDNSVASGLFGTVQSLVNPPTSILGSFLGGNASPRLIQLKAQLLF